MFALLCSVLKSSHISIFPAIQVMSSTFRIIQHYQGLTRGHLDKHNLLRTDLMLDPRSKALVLNGRPGHLQFYNIHTDMQLFNVSIALLIDQFARFSSSYSPYRYRHWNVSSELPITGMRIFRLIQDFRLFVLKNWGLEISLNFKRKKNPL